MSTFEERLSEVEKNVKCGNFYSALQVVDQEKDSAKSIALLVVILKKVDDELENPDNGELARRFLLERKDCIKRTIKTTAGFKDGSEEFEDFIKMAEESTEKFLKEAKKTIKDGSEKAKDIFKEGSEVVKKKSKKFFGNVAKKVKEVAGNMEEELNKSTKDEGKNNEEEK